MEQKRPNMSLKKNEMLVQAPHIRNTNFCEVALGYSEAQAVNEAERCLNCPTKPCVSHCPVSVDIPAFISKIRERDFKAAYDIISASSTLPAVCGRVCPQESQCEGKCVRGVKGESVAIGRLERFAADWYQLHCSERTEICRPVNEKNQKRIAVVGSGPSGLACAGDLAKLGYQVTIFEALHVPGGVLVYGIPEFRLPKKIVENEINKLKKLDVEILTNVVIGKSLTVDDLFDTGYAAVYLASGAGLPMFMNIPGENYKGVYSANEFLTRINLMKAYQPDSATPVQRAKKVAIVGGGNVAMDAARSAKRLGADEVYVIYRRSREELPARKEEVEHAEEEGIKFCYLTNPTVVIGNKENWVTGIQCVKMKLGEPDASGRKRPIPVENSEFVIDVDAVIMSLGTTPNPLLKATTKGLETNQKGCIIVDEAGMTSRENVFAGGDAVTGAATVIKAMEAGRHAAAEIDKKLNRSE